MGRNTTGVRGIRLREGDAVVGMALVEPGGSLLTVCENGYGKRTDFEEYSAKHRGGYGVITIKTTKRNGACVGMVGVQDDDEIMMVTANGMLIRMAVSDISNIGRNAQGVRLMRMKQGDSFVSVTRIEEKDIDEAIETPPDAPREPAADANADIDGLDELPDADADVEDIEDLPDTPEDGEEDDDAYA